MVVSLCVCVCVCLCVRVFVCACVCVFVCLSVFPKGFSREAARRLNQLFARKTDPQPKYAPPPPPGSKAILRGILFCSEQISAARRQGSPTPSNTPWNFTPPRKQGMGVHVTTLVYLRIVIGQPVL